MATIIVNAEDEVVVLILTSRCVVCGHETDEYVDVKQHVDANPDHYFFCILR